METKIKTTTEGTILGKSRRMHPKVNINFILKSRSQKKIQDTNFASKQNSRPSKKSKSSNFMSLNFVSKDAIQCLHEYYATQKGMYPPSSDEIIFPEIFMCATAIKLVREYTLVGSDWIMDVIGKNQSLEKVFFKSDKK